MTKTIAQTEKFIRDRLDAVEAEYEERKAENTIDSEDRGYFEGVIDAYLTVINHIDS
jgi:hypothetical protein